MKIADKVAIVTGGASGLGGACTRMICAAGGKAIVVDVNQDAGTAIAAETGAMFVKADVSDAAAIEAVVKQAGRVDILINCAGIGVSQRVISKDGAAPLADFERVIRVNLIGTYNCIRVAAAAMATNAVDEGGERGVIINTASIAAFDGQIGQSAYSASKGGIVGMTLPLARDLSKLCIRVMTIAPGVFDTPLLSKLPPEVKQVLGANVPHPSRLGDPAEYASLAQHIIENAMLNGEVIRIDGALRMPPK
jgi:NAD(P)-dependent dehydrogenase (short-subunit alcohol dehydrogenase family)